MAWGGGLWPGQIPVVSGLCSTAPPLAIVIYFEDVISQGPQAVSPLTGMFPSLLPASQS